MINRTIPDNNNERVYVYDKNDGVAGTANQLRCEEDCHGFYGRGGCSRGWKMSRRSFLTAKPPEDNNKWFSWHYMAQSANALTEDLRLAAPFAKPTNGARRPILRLCVLGVCGRTQLPPLNESSPPAHPTGGNGGGGATRQRMEVLSRRSKRRNGKENPTT